MSFLVGKGADLKAIDADGKMAWERASVNGFT